MAIHFDDPLVDEASEQVGVPPELVEYEIVPSNFLVHQFRGHMFGADIVFQVMKMHDALYMWIGPASETSFTDLCVAVQSRFDKLPLATPLLGQGDQLSLELSKKLSKRFGKQLFLSCNIIDFKFLPGIQERILEEFTLYPDKF